MGCCEIAWCMCGSNGWCRAAIRGNGDASSTSSNCCCTILMPSNRLAASGVFSAALDRPLDVVQHRQQVAQQRQVRVAAMLLDFAGGPLAVVLQFGLAAQHAVLGRLQVVAQLVQQMRFPPPASPLAAGDSADCVAWRFAAGRFAAGRLIVLAAIVRFVMVGSPQSIATFPR